MQTQDIVDNWRREAMQEAVRGVLLPQLRQRFGKDVDAQVEQRVAMASSEQLKTWVGRVLTAATLTELFAD